MDPWLGYDRVSVRTVAEADQGAGSAVRIISKVSVLLRHLDLPGFYLRVLDSAFIIH